MKHQYRKSIAIMLVVVLTISMFPTISFAGASSPKTGKKYLYIGDSMSFNFVNGRHHYTNELGPNEHYPALVAARKGYVFDEQNNSCALTLGGIRSTDAYALLSDYEGDDYTHSQYNITGADRKEAHDLIQNSDVITIQLGHSNISTYGLGQILYSFGLGDLVGAEDGFGSDLNKVFTEQEINRAKPLVQKCIQSMGLKKIKIGQIEEEINAKLTNKYRAQLIDILGEDFVTTIEKIQPAIANVTDAIAYSLLSDMVHFDRMMERIYDINEDAEVYVMGLFNPMPQLDITYTLKNTKITLPMGDILGALFDAINEYYRVYSEYSDRYYYIEPASGVETYGALLAKGGEKAEAVAKDFIIAMLNDDSCLKPSSSNTTASQRYNYASEKAALIAPGLTKIAAMREIDISKIMAENPSLDNVAQLLDGEEEDLVKYIENVTRLEQGEFASGSYFDRVLVLVYLVSMLKGVYVHPSKAGHEVLATNVLKAMENPAVNSDAIAFHKTQDKIANSVVMKIHEKNTNNIKTIKSVISTIKFGIGRLTAEIKEKFNSVIANLSNSFNKTLSKLFG